MNEFCRPVQLDPQIQAIMDKPFEADEVRQDCHPDHNPRYVPRYINAPAFIRRMNEAFGPAWSMHVDPWQIVHGGREVVTRVTLCVNFWAQSPDSTWVVVPVSRSHYGQGYLKWDSQYQRYNDFGYAVKASVTDAIRKIGSTFGIGLHLYEDNEAPFQGMNQIDTQQTEQQFQQATASSMLQPAQPFQIAAIRQLFESRGVPEAQWLSWLQINDPSQITGETATQILSGVHPAIQHLNIPVHAGLQGQNT